MKKILLSLFVTLDVVLVACAPNNNFEVQSLAQGTVQNLSCDDFQTSVWDGVKDYLKTQTELPTAYALSGELKKQLADLQKDHPNWDQIQIDQLSLHLNELFSTILDEAPTGEKIDTAQALSLLLSAIDVGDRTTAFREHMVSKTRDLFQKIKSDIQSMNLSCPHAKMGEAPVAFESHQLVALQSGLPLAVFGERWAFATAYQSCNTLRLPAMTNQTPDVSGIEIVGTHKDKVGKKRLIGNLAQVQKSHYYIKDVQNYPQGCFNVRQNPLIYDYGGKPYTTTAADSPINLFKNGGDGTSVLGIDCSGFVFTSFAVAGLKMQEGRALKASDAEAWSSYTYVEPQKNGLTCLDKITVTPTANLKAGDVVAIAGHVFMIDRVGSDPFGISKTKSVSDCSKMNANRFDFVIAQSSNSKNGLGINHYQASDYLAAKDGVIRQGLEKYASYACQAYYNKRNYLPNLGTLSVVRHKGTKACMATRVKLTNESCIQSCQGLTAL